MTIFQDMEAGDFLSLQLLNEVDLVQILNSLYHHIYYVTPLEFGGCNLNLIDELGEHKFA